ncbi:SdpI family protein [Bacillus pacificus]|nr:SdpI family protein [Bacillus pacificus]
MQSCEYRSKSGNWNYLYINFITIEKRPPTDINAIFGYRTTRSMKNMKLWEAGNRYSSEIMTQNGVIIIILGSIISLFLNNPSTAILLIMGAMLLLIISMFIRVENKLKKLEELCS